MLKKYLLIFIAIGVLSFTGSYTAPTYDDINFSLCSGYTAPTYDDINFSLALSDACVSDTCTYTSGNWEIDMADFCVISDDCDLGTGKLSFTGAGNCTVNAVIDTTDMGDPGSAGVVWMKSLGLINVG